MASTNEVWVPIEMEPELLIAVGRIALSFAALETAIEVLLVRNGATKMKFSRFALKSLKFKLGRLKSFLDSKDMASIASSVARIEQLSETRNNLMHGCLYDTIWPNFSCTAINFGMGRSSQIVPKDLDDISQEVITYARTLVDLCLSN